MTSETVRSILFYVLLGMVFIDLVMTGVEHDRIEEICGADADDQ